MAGIICPNCGLENISERRSCKQCGASLLIQVQTPGTSRLYSIFVSTLTPGEQLLTVVENLSFAVLFVPNVGPHINPQTTYAGALALTTHRIIAAWAEGRSWNLLHIPAINNLSERPLRSPYQATIMIPGGMGIVVQTATTNADHANQLSRLLTEGLMRFSIRWRDEGALTAMITHIAEEEKRRRAQDE